MQLPQTTQTHIKIFSPNQLLNHPFCTYIQLVDNNNMSRVSQRSSRKRDSNNFVSNIKPLTSDGLSVYTQYTPSHTIYTPSLSYIHIEQAKLRKALLSSSDMKCLNEIDSHSLRLLLLKRKIELCLVTCDWHKKHEPIESRLIANKRKILLEILEFYGQRKFKSLDLLKQSFKLLWLNLFRSLPDPNAIRTDPNDDEMDFREVCCVFICILQTQLVS